MGINSNNYEAFLLDYFENNLPPEKVAELMIFLESHPELKVETEGFEEIALVADHHIQYPGKEDLKKKEIISFSFLNADNYEAFFVASVDGELTAGQEKDLSAFIALNPLLKKEYELFGLTVLKPDTTVIYSGKEGLKHQAVIRPLFRVSYPLIYRTVAVAASIILLLGIYFNFRPVKSTQQLAQGKDQVGISTGIPAIGHAKTPATQIVTSDFKNTGEQNNLPASLPAFSHSAINKTVTRPVPGSVLLASSSVGIEKPAVGSMEHVAGQHLTTLSLQDAAVSSGLAGSERTYFVELYGYIQVREQRQYEEYLAAEAQKPWYAKVYTGIRNRIYGPEDYEAPGVGRQNEFWALAEAGIKGVNLLTNSNLRLMRQLDEDGNTVSYAVVANKFQYAGKVEK
ncbi:MAG: hypothetical protein NTU44_10800 [Bacteroidetes bacterium]|nr:hypothetical protein [Bacteroidota bacterium]